MKMNTKEIPVVMGGQGRTSSDIESAGITLAVYLVLVALIVVGASI